MKSFPLLFAFLLLQTALHRLSAQTLAKHYPHQVQVDSVVQTKGYTYLKVRERLNGKDSLVWMALPTITCKPGDVFYYESGLPMGSFQSKELNRTFDQILFMACLSTSETYSEKTLVPPPVKDTVMKKAAIQPMHTVLVQEVIQTSGYTYLRVLEGKKQEWLAVVKLMASKGQSYTYTDAVPMKEFYSRELNRTFDEVLFLSKLTRKEEVGEGELPANHPAIGSPPNEKVKSGLKDSHKITTAEGGITIAELLKNKKSYAGKQVKVRGEVTKYSSNILNKNWIHLEDGSSSGGIFDIAITSDQEVKVGDTVTFEGVVGLDKDFGYGYFFEIILESGIVVK